MVNGDGGWFRVGSLETLKQRDCQVVAAAGQAIAVFYHQDKVYALDNRCPHMGFPLYRGSLKDGLLTCHWHHARFDLESGGTFDLFSDDVRAFPVQVVDGEVWVDPSPPAHDVAAHWFERLEDSLEHNIRLVTAKAVIGLWAAGVDYRELVRAGARFGTRNSADGWGAALTILTAMANILPHIDPDDRPLAIYHGLMQVARESAGRPPRFMGDPLPAQGATPEALKEWFRRFIHVRDSEGAERCLLTAIEIGLPPQQVADMLFAAATDHIFMDVGHSVDFANKAFELLDHIGWEEAGPVLSSLVPGLAAARRSEETSAWRHPVDIAGMLKGAFEELPALIERGRGREGEWTRQDVLLKTMLADDPGATIDELKEAVAQGATFEELAQTAARAASMRVARFHTSNEFGDWDTVHHTFTYANAVDQAMRRAPSAELLRGVFDAAMAVYLDRFLNVPPARIPDGGTEAGAGEGMPDALLQALDVQQRVEEAAGLVARNLGGENGTGAVREALGSALLREDAGFHSFQEVEAGFRQHDALEGTEAGRNVLVGVARFLAAHSPTSRAVGQTYQIAHCLHRGEKLYE